MQTMHAGGGMGLPDHRAVNRLSMTEQTADLWQKYSRSVNYGF